MDLQPFLDRIKGLYARGAELRPGPGPPAGHETAWEEAVAALEATVGELREADEELRQQNDALQGAWRAVEDERRRYRDLFDHAPDAYLVTDPFGNIREANHAAVALLGVPAELLAGKPLGRFVDEEQRREFRSALSRMAASAAGHEWWTRIRPKGGEPRDVALTVSVVRGAPGGPITFRWLLRDATAHRDAREAQALLTAVLASSDDAIIGEGLDGTVVAWSDAATRLYGYEAGEAIGRPATLLAPPDRADEVAGLLDAARRGERVEHLETRRLRKDGSTVDVSLTVSPIRDASGRTIGASEIAREVGDRERAERQSRAAFDASLDAIVIADDDGRYTDANPAACALYGVGRDRLIGRRIDEFAPPGFDFERAWRDFLTGGYTTGLFPLVRPDGSVREVEFASTPHFLPGRHMSIMRDATERRRAEAASREADRLARSVLDSLSAQVAVVDGQGTIVAANRAWRRFARDNGGDEDAVCEGANYLRVCDAARGDGAADAGAFAEAIRAVLAGRLDAFTREYACHSANQRRWFSGRVVPFQGEGPPRAVIAHTDITVRCLAEEAARRGEELLRSFYDTAPMMMGVIEPRDGRLAFVSANEATARFFGTTPEALRDRDAAEVDRWYSEGSERLWLEWARRSRDRGEPTRFEYEHPTAAGPRWLSATVCPIAAAGGEGRFAYVVEDVTDRRRTEESLRLSEQKFRRVLENARELIYQLDLASGRYDYVSPAAAEVIGRSADELLAGGLPLMRSLVHPEDRGRWETLLEAGGGGGPATPIDPELEYRIDVPGKGWRWVREGRMLVLGDGGSPAVVVGDVRDVTEKKRAEARLRDYGTRLRRLSRRLIRAQEEERRRIAWELHDEMGQVLTAAKIGLQGVLPQVESPEARGRLAESVALIERLLGQVRDLSRALRPSVLDNFGLVAALRSLVGALARRSGVEVQYAAEESIGRVDPDVETACYRVAQEALTNVERHARARHLRVELARTEAELRLSVVDDGAGFDVGASTARAGEGESLGLPGMYERAALIHGRLEIVSRPGAGTEVRAAFPLRPGEIDADADADSDAPPGDARAWPPGP